MSRKSAEAWISTRDQKNTALSYIYLMSGQFVASICYTRVSLNTSVKTFPNVCRAAENTINLLITYCISPTLPLPPSLLKLLCAWPSDLWSSLFAAADASCQMFWIRTTYTRFLSPEWMVWLYIEEAVERHILLNPYSSVHPNFLSVVWLSIYGHFYKTGFCTQT